MLKGMNQEDLRAMEYGELGKDDIKTQSDNVEFSAFFTRDLDKDGNAEKIKGTCKEINSADTLYTEINISRGGYLENGQITLNAKNFTWTTSII